MDHSMHSTPNGAGHEKSEVSVRFIVVSLGVLLVGTFLGGFAGGRNLPVFQP